MDRPRSPVQDAGRWVRSIQPLWCPPVAKHEERGRPPAVGRDDPARWRLFDCQWRLIEPPQLPPRRPLGAGPRLPPVHRLLQPARHGTELRVVFVAMYHLLDVVVVVVIAAVAEVLPVADPVPAGGYGAGYWHDSLSFEPDSRHPLLHPGDDAHRFTPSRARRTAPR